MAMIGALLALALAMEDLSIFSLLGLVLLVGLLLFLLLGVAVGAEVVQPQHRAPHLRASGWLQVVAFRSAPLAASLGG